jgi:antitoxin PrlF
MIISRITSKAQTTIPRAVRVALGINPGDELAYEIKDGTVTLKRVTPDAKDPFLANISTFTEWDSEADRIGYANL